jgi:endo-beta-N-acetylglucosaminidase D
VAKPNGTAERCILSSEIPDLTKNQILGEGYLIFFHWMNYGCKNEKVRDLTKKEEGMSLPI